MKRELVIGEINARLRSGRVPFKTPVQWERENLELIVRLTQFRMHDALRSGPNTHAAIVRTKQEIDVLSNALAGVDL